MQILCKSIILAISFLFVAFPVNSAETGKIYLGKDAQSVTRKLQSTGTLSCAGGKCFSRPSDVVISSDGSFLLAADSSTGVSIKKFFFSNNSFTEAGSTQIPVSKESSNLVNLVLSGNDNKVIVYRESTSIDDRLLKVVNLSDNSIQDLSTLSSVDELFSSPVFLDREGKNLAGGILDLAEPKIVIINTETSQIINQVDLNDTVRSIYAAPGYDKAVITYSNDLAQSVSIFDIKTNKLQTLSVSQDFIFDVEEFQSRVDFSLSGDRAVLSSFGGNHVLHSLDLKSEKLNTLILDTKEEGPTISTISPDGKTAVSAGNILSAGLGFKIYKTVLKSDGTFSLVDSMILADGGIVLDVDILPDQSKVFLLTLNSNSKLIKVFNLDNLSFVQDIIVSSDNADSFLLFDLLGRYAITPNTSTETTVSFVTDLNLGPVLTSILPTTAPASGNTPFVINGFIDLTRFSSNLQVCFRSLNSCASSLSVSRDGKKIVGITPGVSQAGPSSVILSTQSKKDSSAVSSTYDGIFQFVKGTAVTITDTFLPEITVLAPQDLSVLSTRRVLVIGKVDGTGSEVKSVLVNGNPAKLSFEKSFTQTLVNFVGEAIAQNDGNLTINIKAEDSTKNIAEKNIKIIIDSKNPVINANVQSVSGSQFSVSGTVDGTGSKVSSVSVNSIPVSFTQGELVSFSTNSNTVPITITATDSAGNKEQLVISDPLKEDVTPPVISVNSPVSGQIIKTDPIIAVSFSVTDNVAVSSVLLNNKTLALSGTGNYLESIKLISGENLIKIVAVDSTGNTSQRNIKITFIPKELTGTATGTKPATQKEVLTLPPDVDNLNNSLIDLLSFDSQELQFGADSSIELSNAPPLPEGLPAKVTVPDISGTVEPSETVTVAKGLSFASDISFTEEGSNIVTVDPSDSKKLFTAILTDEAGRTFVVGFSFFKEITDNVSLRAKYKFQTVNGAPLSLLTTLNVPADVQEGAATVSILSGNNALATIPIQIREARIVTKVNGKDIQGPQIQDPIVAVIGKNGTQLKLNIKGKNFIKRIAVIDGKLEKLAGKIKFLTNVTFVPQEGIQVKEFKFVNNKKIVLIADITDELSPGIKLFNVITPKGVDNGAIVIPENITPGKLQTSSSPESLLLSQ